MHWPKHYEYDYKDEDGCLNTLDDKRQGMPGFGDCEYCLNICNLLCQWQILITYSEHYTVSISDQNSANN